MKKNIFKSLVVGLNLILILLFIGFFIGHGKPQSLILWSSAIIWLLVPIANLLYIFKIKTND